MSELRERFIPVLTDVADGDLTYPAATSRILALVAEALLSDDAVEAANNSLTMRPSLAGYGALASAQRAAGIPTTGEEVGE